MLVELFGLSRSDLTWEVGNSRSGLIASRGTGTGWMAPGTSTSTLMPVIEPVDATSMRIGTFSSLASVKVQLGSHRLVPMNRVEAPLRVKVKDPAAGDR